MTTSDEPSVPIVPGPPHEPLTPPYPAAPVPPPPQPQPVYYQQPPQAPTWNPGRAAGNTVVVLVVLFVVFCVLPAVVCGGILALGSLGSAAQH